MNNKFAPIEWSLANKNCVTLMKFIEIKVYYGFFLQVRNIEYKDPVEEEWEKFQKEIKEEASASAEIIAGEQEEATAERQIDEIDEQIRNWSRYVYITHVNAESKRDLVIAHCISLLY